LFDGTGVGLQDLAAAAELAPVRRVAANIEIWSRSHPPASTTGLFAGGRIGGIALGAARAGAGELTPEAVGE